MSNPLDDDTSRWVLASARFETPQIIVDDLRDMFRQCFGDEAADAMEASIPPPYGTMARADVDAVLGTLTNREPR